MTHTPPADSDQPHQTDEETPMATETTDPDLAARAEATARYTAQIAAQAREEYAVKAEIARQAAAERRQAQIAAQQRITERRARLAQQAPSDLPRDPRVPDWIDPFDQQSVRRAELFETDLHESGIGQKIACYRLTDVMDVQAAQIVGRWINGAADRSPNSNLVIQGPKGTGKTATAVAAARDALAQGLRVRLVTHANYLDATKPNAVLPPGLTLAQYKARYAQADVLIVDDLAAMHALTADEVDPSQVGSASEHAIARTMELIGDRATAGKHTMVTTNLRYLHLEALYGARFTSRLGQNLLVAKMLGADLRAPCTDW